ncbi:MAG TPA: histone deacetylase [Solibacterales bacterium]|nr:histone deacetylase [Bryobacterales bacterium]
MSGRLFYCDHYAIPLPEGHKFPMRKYRLVRDLLAADGHYSFECAPLADTEVVSLAHDAAYVKAFVDGTLPPAVLRRIGFPWSEGLVRRTLASVGGTLGATRDALETGYGGNLAGGTHHAFRDEGSGFCVFNDIAVAIESLRRDGRVRRAAVVDLDVHQGDGTALIFEHEPDVLTLSLHGRNNFPFRKQRSKIDVDLPDATGDEEYLRALHQVLPAVFAFRPEIVYYQSGVDALATDTLGRLSLTAAGMEARDRMVMTAVRAAGVPLVITLGGGYSRPIERTAEAHATTFRVASQVLQQATIRVRSSGEKTPCVN